MSESIQDMSFSRQCIFHAQYHDKYVVRSSRIDRGVIHYQYGPSYGGEIEWLDELPGRRLQMPIPLFDGDSKPAQYRTDQGRELISPEHIVDYPTLVALDEPSESLSVDMGSMQAYASNRRLQAGASKYLTASVLYDTQNPHKSDAFVVKLYFTSSKERNNVSQWIPLPDPAGGEAKLEFNEVEPNTRAYPMATGKLQYFHWAPVPSHGWLIARITDVEGSYNPLPDCEIVPESWFDAQTQWAFVEIEP